MGNKDSYVTHVSDSENVPTYKHVNSNFYN